MDFRGKMVENGLSRVLRQSLTTDDGNKSWTNEQLTESEHWKWNDDWVKQNE